MIMPYLYVAPSGKKGRGIFSKKNIPAETVIEISPVVVLSAADRKKVEGSKLGNYIFEWGWSKKLGCMALGYVSLYNHNYVSNCEYDMDYKNEIITIKTVRAIKKGEELTINYNAVHDDDTPIWFHKKVI